MTTRLEIECPYCGKEDIKFGLAVCTQCEAEIHYLVREASMSEEDMQEYEARHEKMMEKLRPPTTMLGKLFTPVTLAMHDEREKEAKAFKLDATERYAAELKRLEAHGYTETVLFQRGERTVERKVEVPPNGEALPAMYRVELTELGAKKVRVTKRISELFKVGVREAIKKSESLPLLLLETASQKEAEEMKTQFEKDGGTCEIKAT